MIFFILTSYFYYKGIQVFLAKESYFDRIINSKIFDEETKDMAREFKNISLNPFYPFLLLVTVFIPIKKMIRIEKRSKIIHRLVMYKFFEINATVTPCPYVITTLMLLIRTSLLIIFLILSMQFFKVISVIEKSATIKDIFFANIRKTVHHHNLK